MTLRVGLTGGIATGKSYALRRLAAAGFHTIDLDRIAHEVVRRGGPGYEAVIEAFGRRVLGAEGEIDRKALGAIVFADEAARERLNAIVHPLVREEEARRLLAAGTPALVSITDAALLVEAGVHLRFDRLVVSHCPPEQQLERLRRRDGLDRAAAEARIAAQMPQEEKLRFAHYPLDTSGSFEDMDRAVDALADELRVAARTPRAPAPVPIDRGAGALVHGPRRGPRGLEPVAVLADIAAAGGLEMQRLAKALVPPADGPWYRAARWDEPGPAPASLAAPVVLWALARGCDPPFVLAAAASLARLTHREGAAIAGACLFALALHHTAAAGRVPDGIPSAWLRDAERWGGAPPPTLVLAAVEAARAHSSDVSAARAASAAAGGDPDLAAAMVGLVTGVPIATVPPAALSALERLSSIGR
ncbi:MAG TPA: dephospho-CoA kinase [Vicinamibacteria bacterium]